MIERIHILSLLGAVALAAGSLGEALGEEGGASVAALVEVGDVVQVTVFEPPAGIRPGNSVTLPAQSIDCAGIFRVPFAGAIRAAGRTVPEIAREIEAKLAARAIDPRIAVTLVARNAGCSH